MVGLDFFSQIIWKFMQGYDCAHRYGVFSCCEIFSDANRYKQIEGMIERKDAILSLREFIKKSYGMMIVTGPTGSGKTTTLYSSLMQVDRDKNKVISIEDPVESDLPGVNQVRSIQISIWILQMCLGQFKTRP